jgi:hypothetical protein
MNESDIITISGSESVKPDRPTCTLDLRPLIDQIKKEITEHADREFDRIKDCIMKSIEEHDEMNNEDEDFNIKIMSIGMGDYVLKQKSKYNHTPEQEIFINENDILELVKRLLEYL